MDFYPPLTSASRCGNLNKQQTYALVFNTCPRGCPIVLVTGLGSVLLNGSLLSAAFAAGTLGAKGVTGLTGPALPTELMAMMTSLLKDQVGGVWRMCLFGSAQKRGPKLSLISV